MEKKIYSKISETLFTEKLANGLTVYLLPKPQFHKTFGLFTTNFGSLDVRFNEKTYPEGIAHFLEHKLFEKEDGDVMYKFGAMGAQTNAFTTFNRTAYLFSTAERIEENTELLLDFVQQPYFTAENVAKEQGIITQEIQMYQDDPDWRLFAGVLAAMYPDSPLADDIAGTPASINEITAEMLYENHAAFYQPGNMSLFLTGPFEAESMMALIKENQAAKEFSADKLPERAAFTPSAAVALTEIKFDVVEPKLALGFRGEDVVTADSRYRYQVAMQLFFAMIYGKTSSFYEKNYHSGMIDDSFNYEFENNGIFHFLIVSLDTENPQALAWLLQDTLKNYKIGEDVSESHLALIKRQMLGAHYRSLNSLEFIANEFAAMPTDAEQTIFDLPEILEKLTITDITNFADGFIREMQMSEFIIRPNEAE